MTIQRHGFASAAILGAAIALGAASADAAVFTPSNPAQFANIVSTNEALALLDVSGFAGDNFTLASVAGSATAGGAQISNIYLGPNTSAWSGFALNFLPASSGATLASDGIAENSLWIAVSGALFDGGTPEDIVFDGGTVSFQDYTSKLGAGEVTIVDAPGVIPLPAAGWLLLTALGGLAYAGRRRQTV